MSWYVYAHSDKAAHVLISNSILANEFTPESFKCESLGFISDSFIFVTPLLLTEDTQQFGTDDIYAPVTFELEMHASDPVWPVYMSSDGETRYTLGERCSFESIQNDQTVIGAFIYGEIPITRVAKILFLSDDDRINFFNPSEDVWYPKELCQIWNPADLQDDIDIESLNALLTSIAAEDDSKLRRLIVSRSKTKAALYQAIKATTDWTQRGAVGNCDSALAQLIDRDDSKELTEAFKEAYKQVATGKARRGAAISGLLRTKDPVLNPKSKDIHRKLFKKISTCIVNGELSSHKEFNLDNVQKQCISACRRIRKATVNEITECFSLIRQFLDGDLDIDDVLDAPVMKKYPELSAVMMLLKQPKNSVYFERACSVLPQEARRYAYMMFGMLNGMPSISGEQKSNRILERRLEEIVLSQYSNAALITEIAAPDTAFFRTIDPEKRNAHGLSVKLIAAQQ